MLSPGKGWGLMRAGLAIALTAMPLARVSAGEALLIPPLATPAVSDAAAPSARVYLAQPIGQVTVDRAADLVGQRMYAVRTDIAGAAAVSFSRTRPVFTTTLSTIGGSPLLRGRLTSAFGAARAALGGGWRTHAGVDLAAPTGSPVAASMDGRVARAAWASGYGLLVTLEHAGGVETRYAHLSSIGVTPGQRVHRGEVIGLVGSTGHSTGPHLHYEVRQAGRAINPLAR
jgi:murein DD-endopeptidase MepM/ murein hydrolase activator NlpD